MVVRLIPARHLIHDISRQITIKMFNSSCNPVKGSFLYLEDLQGSGHLVASWFVTKRYESVEEEEEEEEDEEEEAGQLIPKRDIY